MQEQLPDFALDAVNLEQALALHQQGRLVEAQAAYHEILRLSPGDCDALHMLGVVALQNGRAQEACDWIGKALAVNPDLAAAYSNLGLALYALQRPAEALAYYARALRLQPDYAEAYHNQGVALQALKRLEDAAASYAQALLLKPDYAEALNNQGLALQDLNRLEESLASFDKALLLRPGDAEVLNNRGNVLQDLGRPEESLASYDRAVQLLPNYVEAFNNRGNALRSLGRTAEAMLDYDMAVRLRPSFGDVRLNRSLCLLGMGDFEWGLEEYEWRWESGQFGGPRRVLAQPLWLGQMPLGGKTLLLHAEQGLGDTLQFCRYAKLAAEQGATVLLEVQAELKQLLAGVEGAAQVFARGEALPAFDCHCPLLSLPLAFGTRLDTIPAQAAYLKADPIRSNVWHGRLGGQGLPKIGLAWSGSTYHINDRRRSIPLADLVKLVSRRARFVSLQKEVRSSDQPALAACPGILHYGQELRDFTETAALVANLDLVISVDTAVAHLAAALGKPVWLLVAFSFDWRWLYGCGDSPWYPTMRLFRQSNYDDWGSVIAKVRQALEDAQLTA